MASNSDAPDKTPQNDIPAGVPAETRETLDARVLAGEMLPPATLMAVLRSSDLPDGDLLFTYTRQLLQVALETRDTEASVLVTRLMDAHPALDEALHDELNACLSSEPDAVYALLRARMNEAPDPRWLERLKVAALCALHIAITDGDSETAINWLRLVAREPANFDLAQLVHYGLLAAAERAREDAVLGRLLIPLALKRDPEALDVILSDTALLDNLADNTNLGRVLRDTNGDALQTLQNHGYDLFVVALVRAAETKQGTMFTPAVIEQAWQTITGQQAVNVPSDYVPERILQAWLEDGVQWLEEPAVQTILALMLRDRRDENFLTLARQLAGHENFVRMIAAAFQRSQRPEGDLGALMSQMQTAGELTPQGSVDVLMRLLTAWEWRRSAMPLVLQLGRLLNQNPTLTINADALWHMLALANESKDEALLRVAVRRLTADIETIEDETTLTERLLRLVNETAWHTSTRQNLIVWWRGFARSATLARLQRIDKALDGKKPLDELRAIVQTILAFRKLLGKRSLQQFAADVSATFSVLQAFNESFEPSPKRPFSFDQTTMRAEIDAHADELTPHEQKIMANNLKELAQLIGSMGDNRMKASLMRRGDDIDRLLMTGEQIPHSAVDTLKWLSGYLSGTQEKDEEDEE